MLLHAAADQQPGTYDPLLLTDGHVQVEGVGSSEEHHAHEQQQQEPAGRHDQRLRCTNTI